MSKLAQREQRAPHFGWYVIQVRTGREDRMCQLIRKACAVHDEAVEAGTVHGEDVPVGLKECFSPKFSTQKKMHGEWITIERMLLPGYVIADAENPAMLARVLRAIREPCHVLAAEDKYLPLDEREHQWVEVNTTMGDRVIPLSFARKVGDTVEVETGPLKGQEMLITKIDRKNCLAHLEFHVGQMTMKVKVGLVIMPNGEVR